MRFLGLFLAGVALAFLSLLAPAHAVEYVFTALHPAGGYTSSDVQGVSSPLRVGSMSGAVPTFGSQHAVVWTPSGAPLDIHPYANTNLLSSEAHAVDGNAIVGQGDAYPDGAQAGFEKALYWSWNGTQAVFQDIHPTGWNSSTAHDIRGGNIVGTGTPDKVTGFRALLWTSPGNAVVNLHPAGYTYSFGLGVSDTQQVGAVASGPNRAALWSGSAATFVDLHPAGFSDSRAFSVDAGKQVGYGTLSSSSATHALLWSGTPASVVDLHPAGFDSSRAESIRGGWQVGYGISGGATPSAHALVWTGSADSVFDLQTVVPANFTNSIAQAVDAHGTITGRVFNPALNQWQAAQWTPIPEPASLGLLAAAFIVLLVCCTKKR